MFDIALPVTACLRSGTRADVGWVVSVDGVPLEDPNRAVAFTPGGGRLGGIDTSVIDAALSEHAGVGTTGRLVEAEISEVDALIAGLGGPGKVTAAIAPAELLPERLWDLANERIGFCLVGRLQADAIESFDVYAEDDPDLPPAVAEAFASPAVAGSPRIGVNVFKTPRIVVVGSSPSPALMESPGSSVASQHNTAATPKG